MAKSAACIFRVIQTVFVTVLLIIAICTASFRFFLAHLDDVKPRLQDWVVTQTGYQIDFSEFQGHWRYFTPSLDLNRFTLLAPKNQQILAKVKHLQLEIDLWQSLRQQNLVLSHLIIDGVSLDLTQLKDENAAPIEAQMAIERLLTVQLGHFSLRNASLRVKTPDQNLKTLFVESLLWRQTGNSHQLDTRVSVKDSSLNHLNIRGHFTEQDTIESITGEFYVHAHDIDLSSWLKPWLSSDIDLAEATIGAEMWLKIEQGQVSQGQLQANHNQLMWSQLMQDPPSWQTLSLTQGRLIFTRDQKGMATLITDDLFIEMNGIQWPEIQLKVQEAKDNWRFNLAQLSIHHLTKLPHLQRLPQNLTSAIDALSPSGQIEDIRFSFSKNTQDLGATDSSRAFAYSASLKNLAFNHWSYIPKLKGLHIQISGNQQQGTAKIVLPANKLDYGEFFQAPIQYQASRLNLNWQQKPSAFYVWSEYLDLQTTYLGLKGQFGLTIPKIGQSWLSFYAEAHLSDVGQTWRYLPSKALSSKLTNYLSASLQGGEVHRARLLWDGGLDDFPYANQTGIFQADVPLIKGQFRFDDKWPTLTDLNGQLFFQNDGFWFDVDSVDLLEAKAQSVTGKIASFGGDADLIIDGHVSATGNSLKTYMQATPLVGSVGAALGYVQVNGPVEAEVALTIPLNGEQVKARGRAQLIDNQIELENPPLILENVQGEIEFHQDQLWSKKLEAHLFEQAVDIDFYGEGAGHDYRVDLNFSGDWQIDKLKEVFDFNKSELIQGRSAWDLHLGIALADTGFNYDAIVHADLNALKVNLPAPLTQDQFINQTGQLKVSGDQESLITHLDLPFLQYQAELDLQQPIPQISRSHLLLGKGDMALLPLSGNEVTLDVATLDVSKWQHVFQLYRSQWLDDEGSKSSIQWPLPSRVNVKAQKIKADRVTVNDLSLAMRKKAQGYQVIVGSEEIAGTALLDDEHLTIAIDYIFLNIDSDLAIDETQAESFLFDEKVARRASMLEQKIFKSLPSIDLVIDDVWVQGFRFGKVQAQLLKAPQRIALSKFEIDSGQTSFSAKGKWFMDAQDWQKSQIEYRIFGENSSDLMGRFAHTGGIQNASFETQGQFQFKGAPWAPNPSTLNGQLAITLKNGYISGVGGAGRLLGLFSLNSIIRKMKLDFSGVFEDGLAFDDISGQVNIHDGIVTTDDMKMQALAGDMLIQGQANLVNRQVDADVKFIPDLTSGLPVLTAFAAAPQTALYVLAVTTVMSPVIDAITQVNYQVSGSLDEPLIQEVSRSRAEVTLSEKVTEQMRQSKDVRQE